MVMAKEKKPPPMIEVQWRTELKAWEVVVTKDELLTIKVMISKDLMRNLIRAVEGRE